MKKFIILSISVLAVLCSCTKNEVYEPDFGVKDPISFVPYDYAAQTKAGAPTAFTGADFGVFGYQHSQAWATAKTQTTDGPSRLMDNVKVTKPEGKTAWVPAQTYYWPKKDMVTFGAYAPHGQGDATFDFAKGIKFGSFTVAAAPGAGNKVDLLYSDTAADKTYANSNASSSEASMTNADGVYLLFHHALAKVNINAEFNGKKNPGTDATIVITGIKFANIDTKGENFNATDKAWSTSVPATQDMSVSGKDITNGAQALVSDYFVMPQGLEAKNEQILVSYTITTSFGDGTTKTETITEKAVDFKCSDIQNWGVNHVYTYNLKISAVSDDPITFDPAVAPWEAGTSNQTLK